MKLLGSSVADAVVYEHQIVLTWIPNSRKRDRRETHSSSARDIRKEIPERILILK